jgi:hypothetical protein
MEPPHARSERGSRGQPAFEICLVIEIVQRRQQGDRTATLQQGREQALQGVTSAPSHPRQLDIDGPTEGQQIEAAVGCRANHDPVWIAGEKSQGFLKVALRQLRAVGADNHDRSVLGAFPELLDGALETLAKRPSRLFDLLHIGGQGERPGSRHPALASGGASRVEDGFQASLVEQPLGTLQPLGQQPAA